jgi:glc operon protein GlcG
MRKILLGCAAALMALPVLAADPPPDAISQPVAENEPFFMPYGAPITLAEAKKVIDGAQAEAAKHKWHLACAVVEPTGELVAFEKMDDTQYASIDIALAKAKAAARFRRSIKAFQDVIKGGNASPLSYPGMVAGEGSFPIVKGGKMIGAIGCSGSASNQDATAAWAGTQEIK